MMDIAVIGNLVVDILVSKVDSMPIQGTLANVDSISLHSGGNAANVSIILSKLGVQSGVFGKIGNDQFGNYLLTQLKRSRVDTGNVQIAEEVPTSSTVVLSHSNGERTFLHTSGANSAFCAEEVDLKAMRAAKIVHYASSFVMPLLDGKPITELLRLARAAGSITSLDTVWDASGRWLSLLEPVLSQVDYILPSLVEAQQLFPHASTVKDLSARLLEYGAKAVVIKMGQDGCFAQEAGKQGKQYPAYPTVVRDTLGAGDSFISGFLTGLLKGWNFDQSVNFGIATASCCVGELGATSGVHNFDQVQQRAKQKYEAEG